MDRELKEALGLIATRLDRLDYVVATKVATKDDLKGFATKDDLDAFAKKYDFESFATKDDLKGFATKDDLKGFATKDDLKGFATKDDLKGFATKDDLKGFATKDDIKELPTKKYIDDLLAEHTRKIIDYAVPRWEFEEFKETVFTKQDYMDHLATLDGVFVEFRQTQLNNVLIGKQLCDIDDTVAGHEKRIRVLEKG